MPYLASAIGEIIAPPIDPLIKLKQEINTALLAVSFLDEVSESLGVFVSPLLLLCGDLFFVFLVVPLVLLFSADTCLPNGLQAPPATSARMSFSWLGIGAQNGWFGGLICQRP